MRTAPKKRGFNRWLRRHKLLGYRRELEVTLRASVIREHPPIRFAIFAQGQTGSRLLCELLGSHSQIDCGFEILNKPVRDAYRFVRNSAKVSRAPAYGFKVKIYQLKGAQAISDPGAFLRRMHEDDWRILYLMRRNLFRQAYSGIAKRARGKSHTRRTPDGSPPLPPVVHVDVDKIITRMRRRQRYLASEEEALKGLPHKRLVYEDDLLQPDDQQRATIEVAEWLGLEPEPLATDMIPNTPRNLRQVIENFEEVQASLRGTEFEDYFREATRT